MSRSKQWLFGVLLVIIVAAPGAFLVFDSLTWNARPLPPPRESKDALHMQIFAAPASAAPKTGKQVPPVYTLKRMPTNSWNRWSFVGDGRGYRFEVKSGYMIFLVDLLYDGPGVLQTKEVFGQPRELAMALAPVLPDGNYRLVWNRRYLFLGERHLVSIEIDLISEVPVDMQKVDPALKKLPGWSEK